LSGVDEAFDGGFGCNFDDRRGITGLGFGCEEEGARTMHSYNFETLSPNADVDSDSNEVGCLHDKLEVARTKLM